jgi:hypothetical protein
MEAVLDGDPEVGRKKTPPMEEPKPGSTSIHLRGSAEWIAYVQAWCGEGLPAMSPGDLVEWAIAELAKAQGRPKPPRR